MKVAIIGGGNMGFALGTSFLKTKVLEDCNLTIYESLQERVDYLQQNIKANVKSEFDSEISESDCVILAVKPQTAAQVCNSLQKLLAPDSFIISIMAGVAIKTLRQLLGGHSKLIRCMPNLPVRMGMGMTAYYVTKEAENYAEQVQLLLASSGKALRVKEEFLIDSSTAISGSGPAYFYYFVEGLIKAAMEVGFSKEVATQLCMQTMAGALAELQNNVELEANQLREQVTSKGGTTEAAINVLVANSFVETISKAVKAAFARAEELSH